MSFSERSHPRVNGKFEDTVLQKKVTTDCQHAIAYKDAKGVTKYRHDGLTEQCHEKECDPHFIVERALREGIRDHTEQFKGRYGEFVGTPGYHEAQTIIADTKSMFETIPAKIRNQFGNNPALFVDFMTNPENRDRITELGLSTDHLPPLPEPAPEPLAVRVINYDSGEVDSGEVEST